MNEREWLISNNPVRMLVCRPTYLSERKRRLFACGCCRRIRYLLTDHASRALACAEKYADGGSTVDALHIARSAVGLPKAPARKAAVRAVREAANTSWYPDFASRAAEFAAQACVESDDTNRGLDRAMNVAQEAQADLLRDIFGNPFRPVAFEPAWRSEAVVGIAQGIYDDRAFERMPILADALQEAGCEHPDILTHCREPVEHVCG